MHPNDAPDRALTRRSFVAGLLATPVAAAPILAACSGGGDDDPSAGGDGGNGSTATSEATTTTAPPPRQPLTGLVHTGDPAVLARPALVVKINNIDTNETARPQAGINQADVVFEERTEGGISRFAAVFHSTDADPVLPVRSARFTDIEICSMLNRPLFANSGGNEAVMETARNSNL
ncbi:MAG TPA: DUF3048 domain-containing protein, partial [Acidimicrobiia bacterium]|nr:DUF3048 domain-containing protein [Acidimicrobiia bacterium]